ncbi:hypothetical protein GCM10009416_50400 [Craurococcus roseus]|uniref:Uncharacterized protein n=1 Tax=Craurococcus roseus TaxID=77585 RepID=A0ABN1GAA4_9PROT
MRVRLVLAAALAGLVPAACGGDRGPALPVACPRPGILSDGADLTRWRPGPVQDLTTLVFDARLTGLNGSCRPGRRDRSLEVTLTPSFVVERGPAGGDARVAELPWFVAVVGPGDEILQRQSFVERLAFNRGETRATGAAEPVRLSLPVGEERRATDYRILVSFELTPEDVAVNRRRGPR